MDLTDLELLFLVNFLHFVCSGLAAVVLPNHLVAHGGSHVLLGLLVSTSFVCYKVSRDFVTLFELRKKHAVGLCLYSSFVSYLVLVFYDACWIIYFDRVAYALTNQVTWFTKEYVAKTQPKSVQMKIFNLFDIVNLAGTITGSLAGGYMYEKLQDFTPIALTACGLTLLALYFLQYIEPDPVSTRRRHEKFFELPDIFYDRLTRLGEVDFTEKWDSLLLIFTYTFAFTIYYSRFAFLLSSSFQVGTTMIGEVVAMQCLIKFVAHLVVPFFNSKIRRKRLFFRWCLVICGVTTFMLLHAKNVVMQYSIFVPMIVTYCFINQFLAEDILKLERQANLDMAVATIKGLINAAAPICFGILVELFGVKAFKVLLVFPVMVCVYFYQQRRSGRRVQDGVESEFGGDEDEDERTINLED